ncbi:MAG TPA: hypothetical protein DEQ61_24515, partial [Streptomyces sp.]|nr:hypothetical protein [Streptomyces sp.]
MISRLREELGVRIPLNVLFECPTPAQLAEKIGEYREDAPEASLTIEPLEERNDGTFHAPASFAQQRIWVDEHLKGPSPRYNVPVATGGFSGSS